MIRSNMWNGSSGGTLYGSVDRRLLMGVPQPIKGTTASTTSSVSFDAGYGASGEYVFASTVELPREHVWYRVSYMDSTPKADCVYAMDTVLQMCLRATPYTTWYSIGVAPPSTRLTVAHEHSYPSRIAIRRSTISLACVPRPSPNESSSQQ
jgi:hypothetical protein